LIENATGIIAMAMRVSINNHEPESTTSQIDGG
jgi:hypothetical protein